MSETETNKTEEASPHKLQKARDKGQVARGADLGFFSALVAFVLFVMIAGPNMILQLSRMMATTYATAIADGANEASMLIALSSAKEAALQPLFGFLAIVFIVVVSLEVIQLRGLVFPSQALNLDFSRVNPGKGLKRVFSMKTLKETFKSILKLLVYSSAATLVIISAIKSLAPTLLGAPELVDAMYREGFRLIIVFSGFALGLAIIDQILARREFGKEMRMSRSEVTREFKEREGDPRQKQKRKQLHTEFASQTQALGGVQGSDMLIVNPEHVAVGIKYNPRTMIAPQVTTKGKNHFALLLKRKAAMLSVPIFESPLLARALFRSCDIGTELPAEYYRSVADLYLKLRASQTSIEEVSNV